MKGKSKRYEEKERRREEKERRRTRGSQERMSTSLKVFDELGNLYEAINLGYCL